MLILFFFFQCIYSKTCEYAEKSNVCDDDTDYGWALDQLPSNGYEFANLNDIIFSDYDNSYNPCYTPQSNGINCDDFEECDSNTLTTSNGPICCTASEGCRQATSVSSTIPLNNI